MAKRSPRLLFTDEERQNPALKKAIQKADRSAAKLEKKEARIPQKRIKIKKRVLDKKTGKIKTRLLFEEVDKKKPSSYLLTEAHKAPVTLSAGALVSSLRDKEDDSAAVDSTHAMEGAADMGIRTAKFSKHESKMKPYKAVQRAEKQADKANVQALNKQTKYAQRTEGTASNPLSKWQQKHTIKKEYAKAKQQRETSQKASEITKKATEKAAKASEKVAEFAAEHPKACVIIGLLFVMILLIMSAVSSCSVIFEGASSAIVSSTYPSRDDAMLGAEGSYQSLETQLEATIANFERTHDYDEYVYALDDIEHDPYVLISLLSAIKQGEWTLDEMNDTISMLFSRQYTLTQTVEVEERTRTVDNGDGTTSEATYDYSICTVTLTNHNLSHIPCEVLTEDGLKLYAAYMQVLGNRPDLFGDSVYIDKYLNTEYTRYEIPPEVLSDERFAAMIKEAEKYLGFPYVWGGASPATSFDCSGFVSWVINHSGWNYGRQTAEGLRLKCVRVSPENAKPGDLIFFEKTYDTPGASHVGIYVGGGMMIHCGDPIQYASVNSNYFRSHFMCYGRLP